MKTLRTLRVCMWVTGLAFGALACSNTSEIATEDGGVDGAIDAPMMDGTIPTDGAPLDAASGSVAWVQQFGGAVTDLPTDMAADADGNLYIAGYLSSPARFGDTMTAGGARESFLASYTSDGNFRWVEVLGSRSTFIQNRVHLAVSGDQVVVAADFVGTASHDGDMLTSAGETDILLAAFDTATGDINWWLQDGGANEEQVRDLIADEDGNVYVAAQFNDSTELSGTDFTGNRNAGLIASYTRGGMFRWALAPGEGRSGPIQAAAVGGDRVHFVCESPTEAGVVIEGQDISGSFGETYVLTLNMDGTVREANPLSRGGLLTAWSLIAPPAGPLVLTGGLSGSTMVGTLSLAADRSSDVIVVAFDQDGDGLWGRTHGSDDIAPIDRGHSLAEGPDGRIVVTGSATGAINLGGGELNPAPFMGGHHAFVLVLSNTGDHVWSTAFPSDAQDGQGTSVVYRPDGDIFLAAPFTGGAEWGGIVTESAGWEDGALIRLRPE